jgi:hypothetical protein
MSGRRSISRMSATPTLGLLYGYRDSRAVLTTQMDRAGFKGARCLERLLRSSQEACRVNLCFHLAMWRMRLSWLSSILFSQFQKGVC